MGCASSKNDAVAETEPKTEEVKKEEAPPGEKPKPQIFAIMRNGHEVIRGAQRDLGELIEKNDLSAAKDLWEKLQKWDDLHMKMEEGTGTDKSPIGMFKLLDNNYEGIAKNNDLYEAHVKLQEKEKALEAALTGDDSSKAKEAFDAFSKANSEHLEKEESIMMPKIQQFVKDGHPMKKYMQEELLAAIDEDQLEFFITFACEILEKHPEGQPRAKVFTHALYAAAKPEQWSQWDKWIKESLSEKTYNELQEVISS